MKTVLFRNRKEHDLGCEFCLHKLALLGFALFIFLCLISLIHNTGVQKICAYLKIMRLSSGYSVTETPYALIRYTAEDTDYLPLIKYSVDLFFPQLEKDFSAGGGEKAEFVIYPDRVSFNRALGSPGNMKVPMGAYYGGVINILSPRMWAGEEEAEIKKVFLSKGPIVHELTHRFLDQKAEGGYPLWFTEGVALYYEHKYMGFVWREDLKERAAEVSLYDIEKNFRQLPEELAYRRVFDLIYDYTEKNGEKSLQKLISNLR